MEEFNLKLRLSPSDKEFRQLIGTEKYSILKEKILKRDANQCVGCGLNAGNSDTLTIHVVSINETIPEDSDCVSLCIACHSTQHFDSCVKNDWVELVNSTLSQEQLIESCRIGSLANFASKDNIRRLKITPEQFLEKIKNDTIPISSKVKVVFTNKFDWGLI